MKNYVDAEKLQEYTTKLVAKLKEIFPGPAQAASTVADMTDESKVYVYTGSETGYTAGNWYYWNGTAWTSGGVYNAVQIETDTTLTESGEPADAKATGDAIAAAKAAVLADLAPAYSTSATYAVGAYVVYNGGLYRCITAISTAEAWTAAHWTAVDLANDVGASLADLKSALADNDLLFKTTYVDGYIDSTGNIHAATASAEKTTAFIPVEYLDVFHVEYNVPATQSLWCVYAFYDANQALVGGRVSLINVSGTSAQGDIIVTDNSVKYLRISARTFGYDVDSTLNIYHPLANFVSTMMRGNDAVLYTSEYGKYINASVGYSNNPNNYYRFRAFEINASAGDVFTIILKAFIPADTNSASLFYAFFNGSTALTARQGGNITERGSDVLKMYSATAPTNSTLLKVSASLFFDGVLAVYKNGILATPESSIYDAGVTQKIAEDTRYYNSNVKSINHRGYNIMAPENTLPAFILSKKCGFDYVETDVRFTSDGVAVLLHDEAINRTARNADGTEISGTVNIADITYEQALTYDFGIWKNSYYAGTKIPTLEQFLDACKKLGLKPYIELKAGTDDQIKGIVDKVYEYGMQDFTTYIGFSLLTVVKNYDSKARLGYICNAITASVLEAAQALQTDSNEVFIDSFDADGAAVNDVIAARIKIEEWGGGTYYPYVSGYTSDGVTIGNTLGVEMIQ